MNLLCLRTQTDFKAKTIIRSGINHFIFETLRLTPTVIYIYTDYYIYIYNIVCVRESGVVWVNEVVCAHAITNIFLCQMWLAYSNPLLYNTNRRLTTMNFGPIPGWGRQFWLDTLILWMVTNEIVYLPAAVFLDIFSLKNAF